MKTKKYNPCGRVLGGQSKWKAVSVKFSLSPWMPKPEQGWTNGTSVCMGGRGNQKENPKDPNDIH